MISEEKKQKRREAVRKYRLSSISDPVKKEEMRLKRKAYAAKNREKLKAIDKRYYEKKKESIIARCKAYAEANQDSVLTYQARYRETHRESSRLYRQNYQRAHSGRMVEYKIKRKIRLKNSSLTTAHLDELDEIYLKRPEGFAVDHIIPLQGKNVSGLHVPWNLQYLSIEDNNFKRHSFDGTYSNIGWQKRKDSII